MQKLSSILRNSLITTAAKMVAKNGPEVKLMVLDIAKGIKAIAVY